MVGLERLLSQQLSSTEPITEVLSVTKVVVIQTVKVLEAKKVEAWSVERTSNKHRIVN